MDFFRRLRGKRRGPLADEPGPSPWHLPALDGVAGASGVLTWRRTVGMPSILVDHIAGDLLLVGSYCWVRRLGVKQLLVWHQTKRSAVERAEAATVHIHLFNLAELRPLADARHASQELDASSESVLWAGGHLSCFQASAGRSPGIHHVEMSAGLKEVGELFLLVDSASAVRLPGSPRTHLWIVRPGVGTIEVLPQDWFNDGPFDFGYQWITQVARDPQSGRLVGAGIRLRPFALDDSGTRIKEWLKVNPFEAGKR